MATSSGPMREATPERSRSTTSPPRTSAGYFGKNSVSLLPRARRLLLQQRVPRPGARRTGAPSTRSPHICCSTCAAPPQRPERAPRRGDVPRCPHRELAGVAAERDGEVGAVHRLPRQDGPGHHVVVPGRERHVHLLARRSARCAAAPRPPAVEQGRGGAERVDVPPRRSRRPARRARHPRAEAPLAARVRRRRATTGPSPPTAT